MEQKLCPRCGAYWACDCVIEEPPPPRALPGPVVRPPRRSPRRSEVRDDLVIDARVEPASACPHDWVDAVGVELDDSLAGAESRVMVCRLCGLYSVEQGVGN